MGQDTGDSAATGGARPEPIGRGDDRKIGRYRIWRAPDSDIIRTSVEGFWSIGDADDYFDRLQIHIEAARRQTGRVRVLVDRRDSPVQSPEVGLRMQRANQDLYRPEDRLAIIVGSSLLKMQLGRLIRHEGSRAFLSYEAAASWLGISS